MYDNLRFLLWNCNGINGKTHVLEDLFKQKSPDIFALTETKLKCTTHDNETSKDYTIYRYDRNSDSGFGGGVLVGISNSCNISVLSCNKYEHGEIISLELSISGLSFVLGVYYRRPSLHSISDIVHWYSTTHNPNTLIIGDFNLPGINWSNGSAIMQQYSHLQRSFLEFLSVNDLSQWVSVPTHDKGNILDLIVSNMSVSSPTVEAGFSDHSTIEFTIPTNFKVDRSKSNSLNKLPYWLFSKADHNAIISECFKLDKNISEDINRNCNVDHIWETFKLKILKTAHEHIPKCARKTKRNHWVTRNTIRNIRKRKRMSKIKIQYPTPNNIESYKALAKLCKQGLQQLHQLAHMQKTIIR